MKDFFVYFIGFVVLILIVIEMGQEKKIRELSMREKLVCSEMKIDFPNIHLTCRSMDFIENEFKKDDERFDRIKR